MKRLLRVLTGERKQITPTDAFGHEINEGDFPKLTLPAPIDLETGNEKPWGYSGADEPTSEQLDTFFAANPHAVGRIVLIRQMPRDVTDEWGIYGNEKNPDGTDAPAFMFTRERRYMGAKTVNDHIALHGTGIDIGGGITIGHQPFQGLETPSGHHIAESGGYWDMPTRKYGYNIISQERTPSTYMYFRRMFGYEAPVAGELPVGYTADGGVVIDSTATELGQRALEAYPDEH